MTNKSNFKLTEYNSPFIMNRADPHVYKHTDGEYYFTASVPEYDRIILRNASSLKKLKSAEEVTIWTRHDKGIMSIHIWAPEIHYIRGKWYIYFAAGDVDDIWAIRPYVLECTGDNPMQDKWIELGCIQSCDEFSFQDFSLDMTVFEHKEKLYCIWAEKVSVGTKVSNLYIAEMENPIKLRTQQVLLTAPDYDWERVDFWVNEGPAVLNHEGMIYITYSASATGQCYCMGMLSISENADLLNPREWKKERYPVLKTDAVKGLFGPGHNSFIKSENGEGSIMIYHARQYDNIIGNPLYDYNRHTYLMNIQWDEFGKPVFDFLDNRKE